MPPKTTSQTDHDLLIEIKTRLEILTDSVSKTQTELTGRVQKSEDRLALIADLPDRMTAVEKQSDSNSRLIWMGLGGLAVLQVVIQVALAVYLHAPTH